MAGPVSIRSSIMDPLLTYKFVVSWEVGGSLQVVAGVSKIGPLKRTTESVGYANEPGPVIPGQTKYAEIELERGIIFDVAFERWANKLWEYGSTATLGSEVSLADFRKHLRIDVLNQAGQIVRRYDVFNCWPSALTLLPELDAGAAGSIALESMTLQNEGWTRDTTINGAEASSFDEPSAPVIQGVAMPG